MPQEFTEQMLGTAADAGNAYPLAFQVLHRTNIGLGIKPNQGPVKRVKDYPKWRAPQGGAQRRGRYGAEFYILPDQRKIRDRSAHNNQVYI